MYIYLISDRAGGAADGGLESRAGGVRERPQGTYCALCIVRTILVYVCGTPHTLTTTNIHIHTHTYTLTYTHSPTHPTRN
jgi:hypothetical protein